MQRISSGDWGKLTQEAKDGVRAWLKENGYLMTEDHPDHFDLEEILAEHGIDADKFTDEELFEGLNKLFDKITLVE